MHPASIFGRFVRCALVTLLLGTLSNAASAQTLGINGRRFTVNGSERFLVLVSYFDAMDVPDGNAIRDFDQLRAWGVDGIRIFPNWWTKSPNTYAGDTLIDPDGNVRESALANMMWYLDRAAERGLIVDISFSAETVAALCGGTDCPAPAFRGDPNEGHASLTLAEAINGVRTVAGRLAGYDNLLFDVQNESNITGPLWQSLDENSVSQLVQAVKQGDSTRIVTASVDQTGLTHVASRANNSGQDVATWHENRDQQWWFGTYNNVRYIHDRTAKPIYLQEPERYRGQWWFTADGLKRAVEEAKKAGAAAWTFHTEVGFYMNSEDF